MRYRLLSYPLGSEAPTYGDNPRVAIELEREIRRGDSCNTALISFHNHSGTHLDAPRHFFDDGLAVSDLCIEDLVFRGPAVLDCPKGPSQMVTIEDLKGHASRLADCDLLILRTGFYRNRAKAIYMTDNPGVSPEAAVWLTANLGNLRGIGIDTLSVGAFKHRELGRQTHRTLLANEGRSGGARVIIEDMDLSGSLDGLTSVVAAPIFIEGVDSAPCTVIGEFAE